MEITDFLASMKRFTEEALKDARLPVRPQSSAEEIVYKPPDVYRFRMPDSRASAKKAPYILHQIVTTDDIWPAGGRAECSLLLRSVFCIWHPGAENAEPGTDGAEDEGELMLLEVMQRWRIAVLRAEILDGRYRLDLRKEPLEGLYYPDDMKPYYVGEYASSWQIPAVEWNDLNRWKDGGYGLAGSGRGPSG